MNPFFILGVGIVIVVGGILVFRLHAFLALILAALAVGSLTPRDGVTWHQRAAASGEIAASLPLMIEMVDEDDIAKIDQITTHPLLFLPSKGQAISVGGKLFAFTRTLVDRDAEPKAELVVRDTVRLRPGVAGSHRVGYLVEVISGTAEVGDRIIAPSAWDAAEKSATTLTAERVAKAFGSTAGSIGIVIAMASIIGKCLLESGAADRIIRSLLRVLGETRAALGFVIGGFALGIPVFFDTVFYLMVPLGKALRIRTGHNYLLYVLTIAAGATMAHSLVPPTPGPLVVAEQLGVSIGAMMIGGTCVGLFTSTFGYFYAQWANRRWEIPLRDSEDARLEDLEKAAHRDASELPPLWVSLLPILLPIVLIGGATAVDPKISGLDLSADVQWIVRVLGDKNIALILSAAVALFTLVMVKKASKEVIAKDVQAALASGGVIILITSAGGAFGTMLKETGIGELIAEASPAQSPLLILPLAFGITTLIRTAQGSATVAMITAAGILAGMPDVGYHRVYLALAIGCGSKPFAWMNDSGFWVICKMSGMTEGETLKTLSPMTALMGVVGLVVTMLGAMLFPLI